MYKIGVIGGMGPLATVNFYERLVRASNAKSDNEHENIIILNHSTMPDRTDCIINEKSEDFINAISPDFKILNDIGVNVIAIPCNTSHYYYDDFIKFTNIPIINMIEATIIDIKRRGYVKACVFATEGTNKANVYKKYADKYGIELIDMDDIEKADIMETIYSIKSTNSTEGEVLNKMIDKYCSTDTIGIIACTELSLIDVKDKSNVIDAMDVLVKYTLMMANMKRIDKK